MKKALFGLLIASSFLPFAAGAASEAPAKVLQGDFSGLAALTTNYIFRGLSQSDEHPAAQAGLTYKQALTDQAGFYIGGWGSNVDFNDGGEASLELDGVAGVTYAINKWSFDVGGIYYYYPGAHSSLDYDYVEAQGTVGYDFGFATLQGSLNWSPSYFGSSGDGFYYKAAATVPLPYGFTLLGNIGHQDVSNNSSVGFPDYTNWGAGVKYSIQGIDLEADYSDTDMHANECAGQCNTQFLFTVSKSF